MNPPEGSKIRIESERGYEKVIAPYCNGRVLRYLMGLFFLAWLGGWAFGWVAAFSTLISGQANKEGGFILLWLIAWTVGGILAFWFTYRLLRPSIPEQLLFSVPTLVYDSGVQPFTLSFEYRDQIDMWKKMFKKRKREEFTAEDIQTLRLRDFESGNRLTVDKGAERLDIGVSLTEIEREWLFGILASTYKVEQVRESNALPKAAQD